MATYNAADYTTDAPCRAAQPGQILTKRFSVSVTTALANADVLKLARLREGQRVVGIQLHSTDMDSNGTPTLVWNIGNTDLATQYGTSVVLGQAAGQVNLPAVSTTSATFTSHTVPTSDYDVTMTAATGPATGATGTVVGTLFYTADYTIADPTDSPAVVAATQ